MFKCNDCKKEFVMYAILEIPYTIDVPTTATDTPAKRIIKKPCCPFCYKIELTETKKQSCPLLCDITLPEMVV